MHERYYIGGGNVAGILGVSPYKTPLQEFLVITGQAEPAGAEREAFFRRRKAFEPVAAEIFAERTGLQLLRVNHRYPDPEHTFIRAELDAEASDGANVEIKTVHPFAAKAWGDEGGDACPVYVTAQAQHGLMVSGRAVCWVLAMIGFDDSRVYRIERDDEIIAGIRAREVAFWHDHVESRIPPPPANADDVLALFARDSGAVIEATDEIAKRLGDLRVRKQRLKDLEDQVEADADAVKVFMGDAATICIDGRPAATWKSQDSRRFNQRAFEAAHPAHPALLEQFKHTTTSRVFRVK